MGASKDVADVRRWELDTKPLSTLYQGLVNRSSTLTSFTLRCQTRRIPRPTTMIAPLPNLKTLVVYDIDPLCYPDDISILLLAAKKLENLKLHWNQRMRDSGEESVNMLSLFGRCITAQYAIPLRRLAIYNLYTRFTGGGLESVIDPVNQEEITVINSMGSSDPTTVFLDDSWRVHSSHPVPPNLKMFRTDSTDREHAVTFSKFKGLERLYLVSNRTKGTSKTSSTAATPSTPSTTASCGMNGTPTISEAQCRAIGSEYLAVIQSHHRSLKHLLLSDLWIINDDTLYKLCQSLPNLEQLGFSCNIPPLESLRQILAFVPKLWAIRTLFRPGSELAERMESLDTDMHIFALATEMWKPEYRGLKYVGFGSKLVFKLGNVVWPKGKEVAPEGQDNSMNARRAGPMRRVEVVSRESVSWIEIWGLDSMEFETKFP
jgi:hypothetical protein